MESMYNKSVKMMYDHLWETHRYLIEPLTGLPHVRRILVKRFLSFVRMVRKSSKIAISQLLNTILSDVRFATGSNMRTIMLMAEKNTIAELEMGGVDIKYHDILESEVWRVDFIREIVDLKYGKLEVQGFTTEELEIIQDYLCTQ